MDKQRFVLAIVLSAAILLGWSLLNPVKTPPPQDNTNANTATAQPSSSPTASPQTTGTNPESSSQAEKPGCTLGEDTLTLATPLYHVKLDKCGGVATSWVIDKNK